MRRTRSSSRSTLRGVNPLFTSCRCAVCCGGSSEISSGSAPSGDPEPAMVNGSGRLEKISGEREACTTSACRTIIHAERPSGPVARTGCSRPRSSANAACGTPSSQVRESKTARRQRRLRPA